MYIDQESLEKALYALWGSAGHLVKIWFTLKHMGLAVGAPPVEIDTSNSTESLQRLFSFGDQYGRFYIPFSHTSRYARMNHDAARSVIQTTIRRWATSGSVVTCDPTDYLEVVESEETDKLEVSTGRAYPLGLGYGSSGFAKSDEERVRIPITAFAIWYGRQTTIPGDIDQSSYLVQTMLEELHISSTERELLFVDDLLMPSVKRTPLSDEQIFQSCNPYIEGAKKPKLQVATAEFSDYIRSVKSMVSGIDKPAWMHGSPEDELRNLLSDGEKAILLYGPPRTGKTRLVDTLVPRDSRNRVTIQIHDGWGYDHLVEGLKPDPAGHWSWENGPLKAALKQDSSVIVLEEINRTLISQALGEIFSLIELAYRGKANAIVLRSGEELWIPDETQFIFTMNTVDKSTEEIDDALLGRVAAIECPPRPESLAEMLQSNNVPSNTRRSISQIFAEIQNIYPLGHGYFSGLSGDVASIQLIRYYKARIRPVLANFLGELRNDELSAIDNLVDELFGRT